MEGGRNDGRGCSYRVGTRDDSRIGRRGCLKLLGAATATVAGVAVGSGVGRAATGVYGEAGFGERQYGGDGGFGVSTQGATDVDATSATLVGAVSDLDGASSADCYFEWRRAGASDWTATPKQTLSSTGSFGAGLSGFEDGVDYEYRAVGAASDGDVDTGSTVVFATVEDSPTVTTGAASGTTDSEATLNGELSDLGGASSADCYFEWRSVGASSWSATPTRTLSNTGPFSADISGLSNGTDYEYRAVTTASDGDTGTGGTVTFATGGGNTAPLIDSYSVSEAGSPNPHCEIRTEWSVSDADGDLETVGIEVVDDAGSVVMESVTGVSGASASGTDTFKLKQVDGQTFDVAVTVTDAAGGSDSWIRTVTE